MIDIWNQVKCLCWNIIKKMSICNYNSVCPSLLFQSDFDGFTPHIVLPLYYNVVPNPNKPYIYMCVCVCMCVYIDVCFIVHYKNRTGYQPKCSLMAYSGILGRELNSHCLADRVQNSGVEDSYARNCKYVKITGWLSDGRNKTRTLLCVWHSLCHKHMLEASAATSVKSNSRR